MQQHVSTACFPSIQYDFGSGCLLYCMEVSEKLALINPKDQHSKEDEGFQNKPEFSREKQEVDN